MADTRDPWKNLAWSAFLVLSAAIAITVARSTSGLFSAAYVAAAMTCSALAVWELACWLNCRKRGAP